MNGLPVHADRSLPHDLSIQQIVIFKHAAAKCAGFRKASLTERSQLLRLASLIKSSRLGTFVDEEAAALSNPDLLSWRNLAQSDDGTSALELELGLGAVLLIWIVRRYAGSLRVPT
jgi:hypothetical protein